MARWWLVVVRLLVADAAAGAVTGCWVVEQGLAAAGSCDGRLIRAHLIPKQRLKRAVESDLHRRGVLRGLSAAALKRARDAVMWDARTWVWMCGGPTGIGGHHGALDYARSLRIPRASLPSGVEEFAVEYGLEWSLERDYGPKEG